MQITLFFIPFTFFEQGLTIYNPQFTISKIKDNAARENSKYNKINEPTASILSISALYIPLFIERSLKTYKNNKITTRDRKIIFFPLSSLESNKNTIPPTTRDVFDIITAIAYKKGIISAKKSNIVGKFSGSISNLKINLL